MCATQWTILTSMGAALRHVHPPLAWCHRPSQTVCSSSSLQPRLQQGRSSQLQLLHPPLSGPLQTLVVRAIAIGSRCIAALAECQYVVWH